MGFLLLAVFRTVDLIPTGVGTQAETLSKPLTIVAMAGLGLGVELRDVRKAGLRVGLVIAGMLVLLIALALTLIKTLHLGA